MKKLFIIAFSGALLFGLYAPYKAFAATPTEAQVLVDQARLTLNDFQKDPNMDWFRRAMHDSKGVLVVPSLVKGGFMLGGSGGSGVFFMKDESTGLCKGPAFYKMGSVTFGLQAGLEKAEVVIFAMTDDAIKAMLSSQFKLGADASAALGTIGKGAAGHAGLPTASFIVFSKNKGVYGGLTFEGTIVSVDNDYNWTYYGRNVDPHDILVAGTASGAGGLCMSFERAGL